MHGCRKAFSLVRSSADPGTYDLLTVCHGFDDGAVEVAQAVSSAVTKTMPNRLNVREALFSMTSSKRAFRKALIPAHAAVGLDFGQDQPNLAEPRLPLAWRSYR